MSFAPLLNAAPAIPVHDFAAMAAFVLGVVQLAGPKGTLPHRTLGWVWVGLMLAYCRGRSCTPLCSATNDPCEQRSLSGFQALETGVAGPVPIVGFAAAQTRRVRPVSLWKNEGKNRSR
jgi:hypothetical protein